MRSDASRRTSVSAAGPKPFTIIALAALTGATGLSCDTVKARRTASAAASLYKDGDIKGAAARYDEAESLDPGIATIHLNLGFAHLSLYQAAPKAPEAAEHGARAVKEFRTYLDMKPEDPRGRNYLIQTFVDTKRYDDAVAFFKPEIDANPPNMEAIGVLGQIAAKVGRFDDALTWYQKRMDLLPKEPEGYVSMGVIIWDHLHYHAETAGERRIQLADRAIAALKKAIELHPGPYEPYTYVNLCYRERAAAFLCPSLDGGGVFSTDAGLSAAEECWQKRNADIAEADKYLRAALDKIKAINPAAVGAVPGQKPAAAPGSTPDGGTPAAAATPPAGKPAAAPAPATGAR